MGTFSPMGVANGGGGGERREVPSLASVWQQRTDRGIMVRLAQGKDQRLHRALQVPPLGLRGDGVFWQHHRRSGRALHSSPITWGGGSSQYTISAGAQWQREAEGEKGQTKDPNRPAPATEPRSPYIGIVSCFNHVALKLIMSVTTMPLESKSCCRAVSSNLVSVLFLGNMLVRVRQQSQLVASAKWSLLPSGRFCLFIHQQSTGK